MRSNDTPPGTLGGDAPLRDGFSKTEMWRARHFNGAIRWRAHRDPADRLGDVVSRHGLNQHGRQPNRRADSGFISDALDELEELRRVNDGIWNRATLDQSLLSVLRSEVGTVGNPLGSHDGQR